MQCGKGHHGDTIQTNVPVNVQVLKLITMTDMATKVTTWFIGSTIDWMGNSRQFPQYTRSVGQYLMTNDY